jgi:hypothetical protein
MSTIQVDRIIPYQSSSVTIEGDVTVLGAVSTGSFNEYTASNDQKVSSLETFTSSQEVINTNLNSFTESIQTSVTELNSFTASQEVINTNLNSFTASQEGLNATFATTGTNTFNGNQTINGALIQSSSTLNEITRLQIAKSNKDYYGEENTLLSLVGDSQCILDFYVDGGNYDTLNINIVQNEGTMFRDYNGSSTSNWLHIPTNTGSNPAPQFQRGLVITGSVEVSQVLQLTAQDPLPAGGVGQLAVSASNLYFYTDSWKQVSLEA